VELGGEIRSKNQPEAGDKRSLQKFDKRFQEMNMVQKRAKFEGKVRNKMP
jgi:CRISPR/Cas system-associated protein endoribonuclease Cas2